MTPRRKGVICQVLPELNSGGVERGTVELAQGLVAAGYRSVVVSAGGRLVKQLQRQGSTHITLSVGKKSLATVRHVLSLRRLFKREAVDIVHVRSRLPAWISRWALRGMPAAGRPSLVSTVHGLYSISRYSQIMTRADKVIAVSGTVQKYLTDNYPDLDPGRITVIPRGIDPVAFPLAYRANPEKLLKWYRAFPLLDGRQVIAMPGRMSRLKGHTDFITLMARIRDAGSNAVGLIIGGHDPRRHEFIDELQRQIKGLSLDNIVFAGHQDDMREIYASSDIILSLSSKPESFGRTVTESLRIGTPVIGYDHGGVGESLRQYFPEGLVPLGDLDSLTDRVLAFLEKPPTVGHPPDFTLQKMTERTINIYKELMERA